MAKRRQGPRPTEVAAAVRENEHDPCVGPQLRERQVRRLDDWVILGVHDEQRSIDRADCARWVRRWVCALLCVQRARARGDGGRGGCGEKRGMERAATGRQSARRMQE